MASRHRPVFTLAVTDQHDSRGPLLVAQWLAVDSQSARNTARDAAAVVVELSVNDSSGWCRLLMDPYERAISFERYPSHAGERPCLAFVRTVLDSRVSIGRGDRLMDSVSLDCWYRQTPRRRPCVNDRPMPHARSSGSAAVGTCSRVRIVSRGFVRSRAGLRCLHAATIRVDRSRWPIHVHSTINRTTALSGETHRV